MDRQLPTEQIHFKIVFLFLVLVHFNTACMTGCLVIMPKPFQSPEPVQDGWPGVVGPHAATEERGSCKGGIDHLFKGIKN